MSKFLSNLIKQSYFIHNPTSNHISFTILQIGIFHSHSYKHSHDHGTEGGEGCHLRQRPVAASKRGHTRETETVGGEIEVDDDDSEADDDGLEEENGGGVLRVWDEVTAHSESRVEVAARSEAGDEAVACSGAGIKDNRWWRYDGV
jgi:hypothetical protein